MALHLQGDARKLPLADSSVDLVITSPPYFAQREYGAFNEIGVEDTPFEYLMALWSVMTEVRRVLVPTGNVFVIMDDKYQADGPVKSTREGAGYTWSRRQPRWPGMPMKSMMMLPWRFAIGCVDSFGWALRGDMVWSKGHGGGPDRARDRAVRTHEYIFHFAIPKGNRWKNYGALDSHALASVLTAPPGRSTIHPAVFPEGLVTPMIEHFCPRGGVVLDPFGGSGVVAALAESRGMRGISVDSANWTRET